MFDNYDIGKIENAEQVEGSNKLLRLIGKSYQPEQLIGKQCPFVFNLETKMLKGLESQGMILCADNGEPVLLHPDKEILSGSTVK